MLWSDDVKSALSAGHVGAFFGAVKGMTNREYHSLDKYYSSSQLKYLYDKTPRHFKYKYIDKLDGLDKQTDAMVIGSLTHTFLLSPREFELDFFVMPELNLRTNDGKEKRDALLLEHVGKTLVTTEQVEIAQKMCEAAKGNRQIAKILAENGTFEGAIFWRCPFSGLNFKAKIDHFYGPYMCEVKSTRNASDFSFAKEVYDRNYDLSLIHYAEGYRNSFGLDFKKTYFICIENTDSYATQVHPASIDMLEIGHQKWLKSVELLSKSLKTNKWISYHDDEEDTIPDLNPPGWALFKHGLQNEKVVDDDSSDDGELF